MGRGGGGGGGGVLGQGVSVGREYIEAHCSVTGL